MGLHLCFKSFIMLATLPSSLGYFLLVKVNLYIIDVLLVWICVGIAITVFSIHVIPEYPQVRVSVFRLQLDSELVRILYLHIRF